MTPLVSIALPVYNGGRFIADAIESILSQAFTDFELIISDNASTDGTPEICREYATRDDRVRCERNETNIGLSANFTRSFGYATGRYFKWMAADDMLGPGYLQRCVDLLEADASIVLVTPRPRLVREDGVTPLEYDRATGTFIGTYAGRPIEMGAPFMAERPSERFRAVLRSMRGEALNNYIYGLMRRELLEGAPLFEPYVGADKVLLSRLSLHGRLGLIEDDLFIWRSHGGAFGFQGYAKASRIWDPSGRGRMSMAIGQLNGYRRAVLAAPIGRREKLLCFRAILEKIGLGTIRQILGLRRRRVSLQPTET